MKKILSCAPLWAILLLFLFHGCRTNDEIIKNERQIQGAEYSSKTLWKEDEKYIKNVIKIYDQYKETVNKSSSLKGQPFWDYAMTMGQFNESYLEVPVVNQGKVVQILYVIRKGSKVYFSSNSTEKTTLDFFQQFIFGKYTTVKGEEERKGKVQGIGDGAVAYGEVVCTTRTISMWYPNDNNNPDGPGHWESKYETKCQWVEKEKVDTIEPCVGPECVGGGGDLGGGTPGLPYPDGDDADEIDVEQLKEYPCAYAVAQELPNLNNDIAKLLKDTFGSNDKMNITFKAKSGMNANEDGYTNGGGIVESQRFNATIYLNADMLTTATKEYILVTMYHEVIHAYLGSERIRLGSKEAFEKTYPKIDCYDIKAADGSIVRRFSFINDDDKDSHPRFTNFINSLENAISSYNPNLSKDIVKAMARSGIFSDLTDSEITLNQNEKNTSTGESKGTKCK